MKQVIPLMFCLLLLGLIGGVLLGAPLTRVISVGIQGSLSIIVVVVWDLTSPTRK